MASEKLVKESVLRLVKAFNLYKPDPEAVRGFMEIVVDKLTPFPDMVVTRAIEHVIETQDFFPKISELMRACWKERDDEMNRLNNRLQNFKDDWRVDVIHPKSEWELLRDDYKKMYSSVDVMDYYKDYGHVVKRVSKEQIAEAKMRIDKIGKE